MSEPQTQSQEKAQMTKPPVDQTQMVAPAKGKKKIKLIVMREFQVGEVIYGPNGQVKADNTRIVKPGDLIEVSPKQAKDLTKKIEGAYAFSGERYDKDGIQKHNLTRARLATEADLHDNKKVLTPIEDDDED